MTLTTEKREDFTIVNIVLEKDEVLEPGVLKSLLIPEVDFSKGVVLSGRAPVWLFAALTHLAHPAKWVATYDPRLGAVVIESHIPDMEVGTVFEV